MAINLPYLVNPGDIKRALEKIKTAQTPPKVTQDFVKTKLQIKGGSGNAIASFLKKIGFANSDGTPTEIYNKYRNTATSGVAVAEALRTGYAPLYEYNEYMHELNDNDLKGLIIEATGCSRDSRVLQFTISCIKNLKEFANFDSTIEIGEETDEQVNMPITPQSQNVPLQHIGQRGMRMNLSYTINLNLPATADISVFNAIFKSLKENILKETYE